MTWTVGIDFGRQNDRTAICAVELVPREDAKAWLDVRYLRRLPVGMDYPSQCVEIARLVHDTPELDRAQVVVDATGVGVAVADQLREVLRGGFYSLTITGGSQASEEGRRLSVPKRDLVSKLSIVMQQRRLRVAQGLEDAPALYRELASFGVSISDSGQDTYGARSGHDDLVLALSYAVWFAERPGHGSAFLQHLRNQETAGLLKVRHTDWDRLRAEVRRRRGAS